MIDLQNIYPPKKPTTGVVQHALKSEATISVMPDGIFYFNDEDRSGSHLIEAYTKIKYPLKILDRSGAVSTNRKDRHALHGQGRLLEQVIDLVGLF